MTEETKKLKWNQYPIDDDIKFRGPLSYRHFKIIGWLLLVVRMIIPPLKLATMADPGIEDMLSLPLAMMEFVSPLSVFFLLVASFSQLLIKRDYKQQMISNGLAALAVIILFNVVYHRYIVSAVDAFVANREQTLDLCDALFSSINPAGFLTFNVFFDLFLCTCVLFFLNHEPTRFFQGEKLKWFRLMALLPVLYELVCLWLKLQASSGKFNMPISFFPCLTTKPPMMFFALCAMIVYHTLLERRFCEGGRTHEEFVAYLDTNRSRWQFAKFASLTCLVAGTIDLIIALVAVVNDPGGGMGVIEAMFQKPHGTEVYDVITKYVNVGFGGSVDLLSFVPIMLLFDYTRSYKNTAVEVAIPILSITLLVVLYLEGALIAIDALGSITREQVVPQIAKVLKQAGKEYLGDGGDKYVEYMLQQEGVYVAPDGSVTYGLPEGAATQAAPE